VLFVVIYFAFVKVGIVSFGPAPCDAEIPAVYTRVAAYTDWITETIEANGGF
jgi:secreted trypsin-like serine protease